MTTPDLRVKTGKYVGVRRESNRRNNRARQRAFQDLKLLHPQEYQALLEHYLEIEGIKTLRERGRR